jgi:glucose/arabinose dehydrogenase
MPQRLRRRDFLRASSVGIAFSLAGCPGDGGSDGTADGTVTGTRTDETTPTSRPVGTDDFGFRGGVLDGYDGQRPTALALGPDGAVYVAEQSGLVRRLAVSRTGPGSFSVDESRSIDAVRTLPNHDDDGSAADVRGRQVTGLTAAGTPDRPRLYVTSSDPRRRVPEGTAPAESVDTNSGVLSRLTLGDDVEHAQLVRGLPRSRNGHSTNGLAVAPDESTAYVAQGGHTNMGAPAERFVGLPEYALSGAILTVDLTRLDTTSGVAYDLPTLADTETPFGGQGGANMARLTDGGPVTLHAPGFRNPYDVCLTVDGELYTVDNGPNRGWGGPPVAEDGHCTHQPNELDSQEYPDGLHDITDADGYYGGHPNPTRAAPAAVGFTEAVPAADSRQCEYLRPGVEDDALVTFRPSTNGLAEYTADAFDGRLRGDLLAASYDGAVHRVTKQDGDVVGQSSLFESRGCLDVVAAGPNHAHPGTVWTANRAPGVIGVAEPVVKD